MTGFGKVSVIFATYQIFCIIKICPYSLGVPMCCVVRWPWCAAMWAWCAVLWVWCAALWVSCAELWPWCATWGVWCGYTCNSYPDPSTHHPKTEKISGRCPKYPSVNNFLFAKKIKMFFIWPWKVGQRSNSWSPMKSQYSIPYFLYDVLYSDKPPICNIKVTK